MESSIRQEEEFHLMEESKELMDNLRGQQDIAQQKENRYRILLPPVVQARREVQF